MAKIRTFTDGVIPDIAISGDRVHLVYGHQPCRWIVFDLFGTFLSLDIIPTGYMPRTNGNVTVTHDGGKFVRWIRGLPPTSPAGTPVGNNATGISVTGTEFYQTAAGVFTGAGVRVADYKPTGIWEAYASSVTMMDDCNQSESWAGGYVHAAPTGGLVVAEGEAGGVVGRVGAIPFTLWPGEETNWPRCSTDGTNAAIACWSGKPSVKVWIGTLAELSAGGAATTAFEVRLAAIESSLAQIIASIRNVRGALANI